MINTEHQSEEKNYATTVRNTTTDIIKGASNTEQIEAMQSKASEQKADSKVRRANLINADNGEGNQAKNGSDDEQNLSNPLTRGI